MINICRKAFFYEQLKLGKGSFFEVPISISYNKLRRLKNVKQKLKITLHIQPGQRKVFHCDANSYD